MGGFKKVMNTILPTGILKLVEHFKAYPKTKEKKIYQYLDEESLRSLKTYKDFKVGKVKLLGKDFKFSHAGALIHSVEELFCDNTYAFHSQTKAPYIIDCGANIGVSVIFFKRLFPEAKVLAFEPDKEIFRLLEENVQSFGLSNVVLENKAVWNKTEELTFFHEGSLSGSLTTDFSSKNNKTVVVAEDLLSYINKPIDFLKIDIEGAELIVMEHIAPNLSFVKNLFIEYHSDKIKPQQLQDLLSIISKAGFRYYIKEATSLTYNPYVRKPKGPYDLQLNISCYR